MPPEMSWKISQLHSGKFIQPSKIVADTVTLLNELTKGGGVGEREENALINKLNNRTQ